MAFQLEQLHSTSEIEQKILGEAQRVVCIRMTQGFSPDCMMLDQILSEAASTMTDKCCVYAVDVGEVQQCIQVFGVESPVSIIFFCRGKPVALDLGANKVRKAVPFRFSNRQEFEDLVMAVGRGAEQGRDVIVPPKDYSIQGGY